MINVKLSKSELYELIKIRLKEISPKDTNLIHLEELKHAYNKFCLVKEAINFYQEDLNNRLVNAYKKSFNEIESRERIDKVIENIKDTERQALAIQAKEELLMERLKNDSK